MSNEQKNKRQSYKKISGEVRQAIIDRIITNGENIKEVSNSMGVNISTCKAILKVFQAEGRIGKKKRRNKVVNVIETFSFYCINDGSFDEVQPVKVEESRISIDRSDNLDQTLEDNAKAKAEKMLDGIIEAKKKSEESAAELQRQLQMLHTQYFASMNPFMMPTIIAQMPQPFFPSEQGPGKN